MSVAKSKYSEDSWQYAALQRLYDLTWARYRTKKGRLTASPQVSALLCDQNYTWASELGDEIEIRALAPTPTGIIGEVASREGGIAGRTNLHSGALRVQYGKTVALVCGDVETEEWDRVLDIFAPTERESDLLAANATVVPHHGGSGNPGSLWERVSRLSSKALVRKVGTGGGPEEKRCNPTIAILSCDAGSASVPSARTLQILQATKTSCYCTNPNGVCRRLWAAPMPPRLVKATSVNGANRRPLTYQD